MKTCGYCGKENEDQAASCAGCATSLAEEPKWSAEKSFSWSPRSDDGLVITAIAATLLICPAVYLMAMRASDQLFDFLARLPSFQGTHFGVLLRVAWSWRPLMFPATVAALAVYLCWLRCRKILHAAIALAIAVGITLLVQFQASFLLYLLPMYPLSTLTPHSPIGFYFGGLLQIVLGIWLAGLFTRLKRSNASQAEPPPVPSASSSAAESAG